MTRRHSYDIDGDGDDKQVNAAASFGSFFKPGAPQESGQSREDALVLTKDGTPCRTCHDFRSWARMMGKTGTASSDANSLRPSEDQLELLRREAKQCPADKDELGRATWTLLHTMSVQVPERPTSEEQGNLSRFVSLLSRLYPCEPCAEDFRTDIERHPPVVSSGSGFARWMCEAHNRVNLKLGKEEFDCSRVFERWRDGWKDGRCDQ